ncbi:MAG: ADP-ribosylglycohydrolase family protein [Thermodesulfobacteriota bacterium]
MEQVLGMIYGVALGDALGAPVEFWDLKGIQERYGPCGIQELPDPALFTDDTQMTLAVAEALIAAGHKDLGDLMAVLSQQFVAWLHSPENNRSPGGSCLYGARQLEAGVPWWRSGKPNSKGCGAAMRVAPIGYLYQHDLPKLRRVAAASAMTTHHHPTAQLAAVSAAFLVKLALDRLPPEDMIPALELETHSHSQDFSQALERLEEALEMTSPEAALNHIGEGWVAEEAVTMALYCFLRSPDDFVATIRRGANTQGDSDSIASIAGGISGAYLGIRALPRDWVERIEKSAYLKDVAHRLAIVKGKS